MSSLVAVLCLDACVAEAIWVCDVPWIFLALQRCACVLRRSLLPGHEAHDAIWFQWRVRALCIGRAALRNFPDMEMVHDLCDVWELFTDLHPFIPLRSRGYFLRVFFCHFAYLVSDYGTCHFHFAWRLRKVVVRFLLLSSNADNVPEEVKGRIQSMTDFSHVQGASYFAGKAEDLLLSEEGTRYRRECYGEDGSVRRIPLSESILLDDVAILADDDSCMYVYRGRRRRGWIHECFTTLQGRRFYPE